MESVESSVVLVSLRRFATEEKILSYELPLLMIQAVLLTELDCFAFYFTLSCFILFLAIMRHQASFTVVM